MSEESPPPKLHVDADWKAHAQAEKERLAREEMTKSETEAKTGPGAKPSGQALPEASFQSLVGVLASQAMMGLGTMKDPQSGGVIVDLDGSRFSIDLLGVLEEKTKGNLTEPEAEDLRQLLRELRSRYVQVTQLVAQSATPGTAASTPSHTGPIPASPPPP